MTRKTLALVLPTLILLVALMAGTTMAMQVTKIKPDTPGVTIIKEVTTLKLKILPPTHRIDPTLPPNTGVLIGPYTLSSGQELAAYVTWSPSYATLFVGVINANTWSGYGGYVNGGSALLTFSPGSGSWYILVYNVSPYTVSATIYVFLVG
ncbi:hypothetical protein [Vulcanisaeta souniana]|uniref:Uncharacterized protein n=1 Tax=Vulcanisaeta souniana JCM 11219 TaxID=1293586 RepID=A0A830E9D6_9CREN|nr:hypothetical protein [Vulcanisaeta souniana]BDR93431.1 hypothetical protein Vsou_25240 [Vulcanisaeta souniana JCM 11219]GGI77052.1 hypothetical protein GCM10007112_12340 [Vulcanisaeta souniana JCM 11219]